MDLQLLKDANDTALSDIIENDQQYDVMFQKVGVYPHFALIVDQYFNQHFLRHWVGRRVNIVWPPRSPDLSLLDFF